MGGVIINPFCSFSCVFCGGHKKITDGELRKQEIQRLQIFAVKIVFILANVGEVPNV